MCLETPLGSCEISFFKTVIFAGISNASLIVSVTGVCTGFGSAKKGSFSSSISSKKLVFFAGLAGSAKISSDDEEKISSFIGLLTGAELKLLICSSCKSIFSACFFKASTIFFPTLSLLGIILYSLIGLLE